MNKSTILRFNQSQQSYLKVTVGNTDSNLTKNDEIQTTDTTILKYSNQGFLLQHWIIKSDDRNDNAKIQKMTNSSKRNTPILNTGSTNLPSIDDSFMFVETGGNNFGSEKFVFFGRRHFVQLSKLSFITKDNRLITVRQGWVASELKFY